MASVRHIYKNKFELFDVVRRLFDITRIRFKRFLCDINALYMTSNALLIFFKKSHLLKYKEISTVIFNIFIGNKFVVIIW